MSTQLTKENINKTISDQLTKENIRKPDPKNTTWRKLKKTLEIGAKTLNQRKLAKTLRNPTKLKTTPKGGGQNI